MVVGAAGVFDEMSLVKLKSVEVQDTDSYYEINKYIKENLKLIGDTSIYNRLLW